MVWTLTIGGINWHQALNPLRSLQVQQKGYQGSTATLKGRFIEKAVAGVYTLAPVLESQVILTDPSGVRAFGGYLRERGMSDKNVVGIREWNLVAQDFNTDLVDDVVPLGTVRNVAETDKAFVTWLITTFTTRSLTAPTGTVDQVQAGNITPLGDIGGMTLYEVLQKLNDQTGARFWVDFTKQVHYHATATTAAPFNIDIQSPNGTTTFPARNFEYPEDSIDYVNEVLVVGATRTMGTDSTTVYRGGSAPAAGTRRAVIYRDDEITTLAQAQQRGAAVLGGYTNRTEGKMDVWRGGLRPGQIVHVKNTMYSIDADFPISQVEFVPSSADIAFYRVTFGATPVTLQSLLQQQSDLLASTATTVGDIVNNLPGADTTPPAQATGFALSSQYRQATDGSEFVGLTASWNANGDADLDAYEMELDRAIAGPVAFLASASGTGGTLTAGTYRVIVTGLGAVYGETARASAPTEVVLTAGQRLFVTITALTGISSYRVYAERVDDPRQGRVAGSPTTAVTGSAVEVTAAGTTGDPTSPTFSTAAAFITPAAYRTPNTKILVDNVQGGIVYVGRVRAVDRTGNRGTFSTPSYVQALRDATAPAIPAGLDAIAGRVGTVGLTWSPNIEPDLANYDIRYSPELTPGTPDPAHWTILEAMTTVIIISGLDTGTPYYFQVRAIDSSGNVRTSDVDSTPVVAATNPGAGWSEMVSATPGEITGDDIAAGTILASHISAAGISAAAITSGTLSVGGVLGGPDIINIYNATGQLIGIVNQNGVEFRDPSNTLRRLRFLNGVMSFSSDGGTTWTTAISADGITADSIKLGTAPGGHNAIPNASFELSAFATTLGKLWTSAADWTASIVSSDVNVNKATTELRMTTFTY